MRPTATTSDDSNIRFTPVVYGDKEYIFLGYKTGTVPADTVPVTKAAPVDVHYHWHPFSYSLLVSLTFHWHPFSFGTSRLFPWYSFFRSFGTSRPFACFFTCFPLVVFLSMTISCSGICDIISWYLVYPLSSGKDIKIETVLGQGLLF